MIEDPSKAIKEDSIVEFELKWSLPKEEENKENEDFPVFDDFRLANAKYLRFDFEKEAGKKVLLTQDFTLGKGGIFWDGSYTLIKYFLSEVHPSLNPEKTSVLELGAGTALPGIVLGLLNYEVVITDLKKLMPFVQKNVSLNIKPNSEAEQRVTCKELEWGNEEHFAGIKQTRFDIILGSELIYIEESFDDLVRTLLRYSDMNTRIIITYKIRLVELVERFFKKFEEVFSREAIPTEVITRFHPNPKQYLAVAKLKPEAAQRFKALADS